MERERELWRLATFVLSKVTFLLRKKESQIMQVSRLHPGVQRAQNVQECSAKEARIVLIH